MKTKEKEPLVQFTDLTAITMDADCCQTRVVLFCKPLRDGRMDWLLMGRANLRPSGNDHRPGCWELSAYMNATDPYHDQAYALRLPLVGVGFERIESGGLWVHAYVDGSNPEMFVVPPPGYAPTMRKCKDRDCQTKAQRHLLVDEDTYVPTHDAALYEAVRGKLVEIRFDVLYAEG